MKVEHQRLSGKALDIIIPMWKWEIINLELIIGLPHTHHQHNSIWVIVDRMTKLAYFLPIKTSDSTKDYARMYVLDYARMYVQEIFKIHGVTMSIISDKGIQFTSYFWKSFQKALGPRVDLSTTFHLQIDWQTEHTIQTLEYMLRSCEIDFKRN